jgi:ADP-heptose:LPS heptosyltransferase
LLGSTSPPSASGELLEYCLSGRPWPDSLLRQSIHEDDGRALLRVVVERLADLFEPSLCDIYARLFARVIEIVRPEFRAADLLNRYDRIRKPRVCTAEPRTIYVLSRVTLGADVAVTSIVLDALKRRFPDAALVLVASRKNYELFAADPRILFQEFNYPRGAGLAGRIASAPQLHLRNSIVVDPDSRLTQLGLLPVCDEESYFFFESRAYGGSGNQPLADLTRQWVTETFSVDTGRAYIAPDQRGLDAEIAVSVGVGENQEKRLGDSFEEALLEILAATGKRIVIDEGAGGDERDRVRRLSARFPALVTWSGAYAPFADTISRAQLYAGYDSAGQHVAAACGVPLLSIFAGYASERMFERWRPSGPGPVKTIKAGGLDPAAVVEQVRRELQNLTL